MTELVRANSIHRLLHANDQLARYSIALGCCFLCRSGCVYDITDNTSPVCLQFGMNGS
jgi:hypothetical protein